MSGLAHTGEGPDRQARERAEARAASLCAILRGIRSVNQLIVRERDRAELVRRACALLVEFRGLDMCGVVLVDHGKPALAAHAGAREKLGKLDETLARGEVPGFLSEVLAGSDLAIREGPGETRESCPVSGDDAARSTVAVRLACDGKTYGALLVSLPPEASSDPEQLSLLQEVSSDLAFALRSIETEAERRRAEDALRASEQRFRTLIEQAPVAIGISRDGVAMYANPMCLQMLGFESVEEIQGIPLVDLVGARSRDEIAERIRLRAQGLAVPREYETIGLRKGGSPFTVHVVVKDVQLADGPANIGFFTDITEQRRTEEQLRHVQKMEAVGQLAGGIAHDFNNVITVVNSFCDLALSGLREHDPLREDLMEIRKAGKRAAALTRQLLAFSRRQVLRPEVLNLNQVLDGIEGMLRRLIGEDIELVVSRTADLGSVRADPGQIEQVVMNLVVNSRDAMPEGGKLTIETANVELDEEEARVRIGVRPGPHVTLSVSDTGCGMDEQTRARIFEPFFTTKESGKGTGLGLATVYGIVKQSGGSVCVDSEPGRGTTFEICLPRELTAPEAELRTERPAGQATGTETVLVVEDEEAVRNLTRRILTAAGYTVLMAANAGEALLACERRTQPVHLLLTDVVMPLMSGRELAERLAQACPGMTVLFMSAYADNAIMSHGTLERGVHFIAKPFAAEDLTRKVREVLDLRLRDRRMG